MDGFDDLLAPTQRTLEANPFADPFEKRSGSPDPWSSFAQRHNTNNVDVVPDWGQPAFGGGSTRFDNQEDPYSTSSTAAAAPLSLEQEPSSSDATLYGDAASTISTTTAPEQIQSSQSASNDNATSFEPPLAIPVDEEDNSDAKKPTPPAVAATAAIATAGEEMIATPSSSKPSAGFRESILPEAEEYSQTETIRPSPLDEPHAPAPLSSSLASSDPSLQLFSTSTREPAATSSSTAYSSLSPSSPSSPITPVHPHLNPYNNNSRAVEKPVFVSPLEQPDTSTPAFERRFASLALGGESIGGWQTDVPPIVHSSAWGGDTSEHSRVESQEGDARENGGDDQSSSAPKVTSEDVDELTTRTSGGSGDQPTFMITVDDPQKIGDPLRPYTMYTVHTKVTSSPLFQKPSFSVLRRYSDFLWLTATLSDSHPGVIIPPVPSKNPYGLGRFEEAFVQQRRAGLQKCIMKIANHPILGKDKDLKLFLESDLFSQDIKQRKAELAHERGGGLIASLGQAVVGPRFHETDEWFDRQSAYLDSLETQLRSLVKSIVVVAKHRQELSTTIGELATAVEELASSDIGKSLQQSLSGLAEVERKAHDIYERQASMDVVTIMDTVDEYSRLINAVRQAFTSRIRSFQLWQNADSDSRRVRISYERTRAQGSVGSHAIPQLTEVERRAQDAKREFDNATRLVKSEVARFDRERVEDFKNALQAFLDGMIERQKELIHTWEEFQQVLLKKHELESKTSS